MSKLATDSIDIIYENMTCEDLDLAVAAVIRRRNAYLPEKFGSDKCSEYRDWSGQIDLDRKGWSSSYELCVDELFPVLLNHQYEVFIELNLQLSCHQVKMQIRNFVNGKELIRERCTYEPLPKCFVILWLKAMWRIEQGGRR